MNRVGLQLLHCGDCAHPEFMTRRGGRLAPRRFPAFSGVIRHPAEGLILFDTGYDAAFFSATRPLPERFYRWTTPVRLDKGESAVEQLARLGHGPQDVRGIILSHFHGDHVAGLHHFPHAPIFCARAGLTALRGASRLGRVRRGMLDALVPQTVESRARYFEDCAAAALPKAFLPFETGADLLGDGSLLAVPLPGHCVGHWGLALRLCDDRFVLLAADAVWSIGAIRNNTPPPTFTVALLGDTQSYHHTFRQLKALSMGDTLILPSHCPDAVAESGLGVP